MGLDNGIKIKIKDPNKLNPNIFQELYFTKYGTREELLYELLYWRKCWNIRDVIMNHLENNHITTCDDCSYDMAMPLNVLESLITDILPDCYSPTWWKENGDSIWTFDEICAPYYRDLLKAIRLVERLRDVDPSAYEIYFYDSY